MIGKAKMNLGELLVRQGVIDEDQLAWAMDEHKRTGVAVAKILVRLGMVSKDTLTSILGVQMQSTTKMRIGEMLLAQGYITKEQLDEALENQKTTGKRLGRTLVDLGFMPEERLIEILVIDSIQTVYKQDLAGTPGSMGQLRECTLDLMVFAKNTGCITILIGHVTKDGQIAGPRILEHMVDTVIYFEGDRNHQYRLIRTIKNRFGATDEIGVFEMTGHGLTPVTNPSKVFLQENTPPTPGNVVCCTMEGSRAMLFETQALVSTTNFAVPQRVAAGIDPKRLTIILALLEKFGGVTIGASDVFASIAGGMKVNDASSDLALALAIASNHLGIPIGRQTIAIGELGLSGEVRSVHLLDQRLKEARRLGMTEAIIPANGKVPENTEGVKIIRIATIGDAIKWLMDRK